jgi:phenylacetate-coenzyme A ligase PaaK-like adenylate-forming protein
MVTSGSPFDIERSAETIRRMNVNSIVASPSIALKLTERLDDAGYEGLEKYYLISSGLSSPTEDKIRERYPEAEIMMQYGLAETGILMKQCKHLKGTNQYHTFDDQSPFYYEFITDEGNEAQPGEIGEITVTKMNRKTPLIRYQVGDLFEMRDECECGERVYKFIGRKEDKFKIQGVTVFRERIEDALESVEKHIKQYQVIIDEREYEDMPKPVIRLRVELDEDTESNKEKIKETFASNFQVAEDYNWQKGVEMGIFAPVEIESNKFEERKFRAVKDIRYED